MFRMILCVASKKNQLKLRLKFVEKVFVTCKKDNVRRWILELAMQFIANFICRYVTYGSELGEHALYCVKILCWVAQSPLAQPELVGLFSADTVTGQSLLQGFVDCLENEEPEDLDQNEQGVYCMYYSTPQLAK